jgi:succinate-semialdehyde dehydrogenase/glutarate-semialdehyde dehydrogenase
MPADRPPSHESHVAAAAPHTLLVNGQWQPGSDDRTFPVEDPASRRVLAEVSDAAPSDAIRAVDAAAASLDAWQSTSARQRSEVLTAARDLLLRDRGEVAELITLEMGKPLAESLDEVAYAAGFLRWYAEEAVRVNGRVTRGETSDRWVLTTRHAVGVCLLVTPWNFPLAVAARKVAPALAAGCTTVLKPASQTPLTALWLGRLLQQAGVPAGVLNVLPTTREREVVAVALDDPRVRKLSFTGSTRVGRVLAERAARTLTRTSMELGGNNAFVVARDAELGAAVDAAMVAKLRNGGEACTSVNRFLVHRDVLEEFTDELATRFAALRVGHGLDAGTDVGPVITAEAHDRVRGLVARLETAGVETVHTGSVPAGEGHFVAPTLLAQRDSVAPTLQEEFFAPVAIVQGFADDSEALRLANDTDLGLAGYVFTRSLDRALRYSEGLRTGMVAVNRGVLSDVAAPFGGVGQSGHGREGGPEGLEDYLDTRYLSVHRHLDAQGG